MKYDSKRIGKSVTNDLEHLAECVRCGGVFDMRDLEEVFKHESCNLTTRKD